MLNTAVNPNTLYVERLWERHRQFARELAGRTLDLTRGKPSEAQLDLSNAMLDMTAYRAANGFDTRNYGEPLGLPEVRKLCAAYLGTKPDLTIVTGNSSLQLMYSVIMELMRRGGLSAKPKFICPSPGYDRHIKILDELGIEGVSVSHDVDGPDMVAVRDLVNDPDVIGMWCMPKFSNPTGITYSNSVAREIAQLKPRNGRFFVMWDNAYAHHELRGVHRPAPDIMRYARDAKTEDRIWIFGSFSKVTFASAGLSMMSASPHNIEWYGKRLAVQTIGPDKLTQLRHVHLLKNLSGIKAHMRKHAAIIRPKFEAVCGELEQAIGGKGIARWDMPAGGYFISFYMETGHADRVIELAKSAGLLLTESGAAYPKRHDPRNSHIRISPTYPSVDDVRKAAQVLALCAEIAHREAHPQTARR